MSTLIVICALVIVGKTSEVKRLIVANAHRVGACDSDILKTYPKDIKLKATTELYRDDPRHDYSESRAYIDTVETTTPDGVKHMGAWSANFNNYLQFLSIEMKQKMTIKGIVTQGRHGCCAEWVTKYRIQYSEDCNTWIWLDSGTDSGLSFKANTDENTKVTNMLPYPVTVKCIRINPVAYHNHISMRVGLLGSLTQAGISTGLCTTTHSTTTLSTTSHLTTTISATMTTSTSTTQRSGNCNSSPCLNNGICKDLVGGYQCFCPSDDTGRIILSGKRCQFVIDTSKIAATTKTPESTTWFKIPG